MAKQFVWLLDNQTPRFGPELRKGETHNEKDYRSSDVGWWVTQGAAKRIDDKPKSKKAGGK